MNRKALEEHLREHGKKHDIWTNPLNRSISPIPRHNQIKRGTVRSICRILGVALPAGI